MPQLEIDDAAASLATRQVTDPVQVVPANSDWCGEFAANGAVQDSGELSTDCVPWSAAGYWKHHDHTSWSLACGSTVSGKIQKNWTE